MPRAVRLGFVESGLDYRSAAVLQQRPGTASFREINLNLPAAVTQSLAQSRADVALEEAWASRTSASFQLLPSALNLEPGDVIAVANTRYRLLSLMDGVARKAEAVQFDAAVYDPPPAAARNQTVETTAVYGQPFALLMDLALVSTAQPAAPWAAAQATPWPGRLAVLKSPATGSFAFVRYIDAQATSGSLLTVLPQGLPGRLDFTTPVDVTVESGALSSISEDELLAGSNIAAIGTAATGYEIIQFRDAVLIAANTYRLSGLLRAQAGSRAEMLGFRPIGDLFTLLNGAVVPVEITADEATRPATWRMGPQNLDHAHPSYVQIETTPFAKALRPLPPAQLRLKKTTGGVTLSWIRQTRIDGDS